MASWAPSLRAQRLQGAQHVVSEARSGHGPAALGTGPVHTHEWLWPRSHGGPAAREGLGREEKGLFHAFLKETGAKSSRGFQVELRAPVEPGLGAAEGGGPRAGCSEGLQCLNPILSLLFTLCVFSFKNIFLTFASWQSRGQ